MARNNNNTLLLAIIGLIFIVGIYYTWGKKAESDSESYEDSKKASAPPSKPDVEFIQQGDGMQADPDSFELLGVADGTQAHQIGFGMGPGIYGSGRHTSEMVGN